LVEFAGPGRKISARADH